MLFSLESAAKLWNPIDSALKQRAIVSYVLFLIRIIRSGNGVTGNSCVCVYVSDKNTIDFIACD